jgi:hypothetical protein
MHTGERLRHSPAIRFCGAPCGPRTAKTPISQIHFRHDCCDRAGLARARLRERTGCAGRGGASLVRHPAVAPSRYTVTTAGSPMNAAAASPAALATSRSGRAAAACGEPSGRRSPRRSASCSPAGSARRRWRRVARWSRWAARQVPPPRFRRPTIYPLPNEAGPPSRRTHLAALRFGRPLAAQRRIGFRRASEPPSRDDRAKRLSGSRPALHLRALRARDA